MVMHDLGICGLGHGTELRTAGGFFILMGVGAALGNVFKTLTKRRVWAFGLDVDPGVDARVGDHVWARLWG